MPFTSTRARVFILGDKILTTALPRGTRGGLIFRRINSRLYSKEQAHQQQLRNNWRKATLAAPYSTIGNLNGHRPSSLPVDGNDKKYDNLTNEIVEREAPVTLPLRNLHPYIYHHLEILRSNNLDKIWESFTEIVNHSLTHELTASDYSTLLLCFETRKYLHIKNRGKMVDGESGPQIEVQNWHDASSELWRKIDVIVDTMNRCGYALTVREYTFLIGVARDTHWQTRGTTLWNEMIAKGIEANSEVYDVYLTLKTGTLRQAKKKLVTNARLFSRKQLFSKIGVPSLEAFNQNHVRAMQSRGIEMTSTTVNTLILGHSRMANINGMLDEMETYWGLSISQKAADSDSKPSSLPASFPEDDREQHHNSVNEGDSVPMVPHVECEPTVLDEKSPLYPTSESLDAIANAMGQNARFDLGLLCIEALSKAYSIEMNKRTWRTLIRWSYILASPRYSLVQPEDILRLFDIMTKGKNMTSNPFLLKYIHRAYLRVGNFEGAIACVDWAIKNLKDNIAPKYFKAQEAYINTPKNIETELILSRDMAYNTRRSIELKRLISLYLERILRKLESAYQDTKDPKFFAMANDISTKYKPFLYFNEEGLVVQHKRHMKTLAFYRNGKIYDHGPLGSGVL